MAIGYMPISFAVAALSLAAGLSAFNTLCMSVLVYAGSSQMVATQLLVLGATPLSIVLATFVVNLRHLLMATALAPHLRRYRKHQLAAFAFSLSDEAFSMHSTQFGKCTPSRTETFTISIALHAAWVMGTVLAIILRTPVDKLAQCGLDYAPAAMFIALLALLIKNRLQLMVAVLCGMLAVSLNRVGLGAWSIILATLVGATVGSWGEVWISRRSSLSLSV
jgi:4-azaleucine resistance transporter AzlC